MHMGCESTTKKEPFYAVRGLLLGHLPTEKCLLFKQALGGKKTR